MTRKLCSKVPECRDQFVFALALQFFFAVHYILAYHYRFERAQIEAAQELLCIINSEGFCLAMPGRFVVMLSQFSVVLMTQAKASLESIVAVYSLHHVAFFHFLSIVCLMIGSWRASLLQTVIPVAAIGVSYFMWPFAELLYGVGIAFTTWTVWKHLPATRYRSVVLAILVLMVFASHPLAVLLMLSLLAFEHTTEGRLVPLRLFALVSGYLIYRQCFSLWTPYGIVSDMWWRDTLRFLRFPELYADIWLLLFLMGYCLIRTRMYIRLAIVLASFLLTGLAIQAAGHSVELYQVTVVMLAMHVILQTSWPWVNSRKPALILVGLFLLCNFDRTVRDATVFTARRELMAQLVDEAIEMGQSCLVLDDIDQHLPDDDIIRSPSFRHETLLLSAISGKPVIIVHAENLAMLCEDLNVEVASDDPVELVDQMFVEDCEFLDVLIYHRCDEELNPDYFPLPTHEGYEIFEPDFADWNSDWVDSVAGRFNPHLPD